MCSAQRERGPDARRNGRGARSALVEAPIVEAVKGLLLQPDVIEQALREFPAVLSSKRSARGRGSTARSSRPTSSN